jgi:hypothetical protein
LIDRWRFCRQIIGSLQIWQLDGYFDLFFRSALWQGLISSIVWIGNEGLQACTVLGASPTDI